MKPEACLPLSTPDAASPLKLHIRIGCNICSEIESLENREPEVPILFYKPARTFDNTGIKCSLCAMLLVTASLFFAIVDDVLAGPGVRLAPDPIATWSRFSFAPSGFGQFVEARAVRAGAAKVERIRRARETSQKTKTVAVYLPTKLNLKKNAKQSNNDLRNGINSRISDPPSSSRTRVDGSLGHRGTSTNSSAAIKVARGALRRLQPSAPAVTRGRDGRRRLIDQPRAAPAHAGKRRLSRSRVYAGARRETRATAKRGQRKVYSLLMETPAWARKAFTSD